MTQHRTYTLRARVQENCPEIDPKLLQEIAGAETLAGARSVYAAGNGRWPNWTFERWMLVVGPAATILVWVFVTGARWEQMAQQNLRSQEVIVEMQQAVRDMQREIATMKSELFSIQRADEYYRTNPRTTPQFGR